MRKFFRSPTSVAGASLTALFLMLALSAPIITTPNTPNPYRLKRDVLHPLVAPGTYGHLLGTDRSGSDVAYGLVWGARLSTRIALIVVAASALIGIIVGAVAAYFGSSIDNAMMRVTDFFFAVPPYILAMAILATLGATIPNLTATLALVYWPRFARVMRSQVLTVKQTPYVEAAHALGSRSVRILARHILPNSWAPLLVQATLSIGEVVLWTAGLAYIGLAPSDITEWGNMVSQGQQDMIGGYWWPALFPGIMIFLFVMGANLLADGIRDQLDPKLAGR